MKSNETILNVEKIKSSSLEKLISNICKEKNEMLIHRSLQFLIFITMPIDSKPSNQSEIKIQKDLVQINQLNLKFVCDAYSKTISFSNITNSFKLAGLTINNFFTENFHLLVENTDLYYEQFLDRQAGTRRRLPQITLPHMMTFNALALQMGHILKDTLHDYWSRLRQLQTSFYGEIITRDRFFTHTFPAFCGQFTEP
jgi:hypothetical protein